MAAQYCLESWPSKCSTPPTRSWVIGGTHLWPRPPTLGQDRNSSVWKQLVEHSGALPSWPISTVVKESNLSRNWVSQINAANLKVFVDENTIVIVNGEMGSLSSPPPLRLLFFFDPIFRFSLYQTLRFIFLLLKSHLQISWIEAPFVYPIVLCCCFGRLIGLRVSLSWWEFCRGNSTRCRWGSSSEYSRQSFLFGHKVCSLLSFERRSFFLHLGSWYIGLRCIFIDVELVEIMFIL